MHGYFRNTLVQLHPLQPKAILAAHRGPILCHLIDPKPSRAIAGASLAIQKIDLWLWIPRMGVEHVGAAGAFDLGP